MHTLCIHLNSLSIQSAYILSQIAYTNLQKQDINTHSIVEYSIVKNSKVNDSKEEKFFDENLQLPYIIKDGKNIYGNDDQIRFGGMSEFAIKKHLEDIENVKNKLNGK
jgi:glutaredoxin